MSVFRSRRFWIALCEWWRSSRSVLPRHYMFDVVNALTVAVGWAS